MKCTILHQSPGRMRVHLACRRMSLREADILEYYLKNVPGVTAVKVFETKDAIANGAKEIDMVINIGWAKDGRWDDLLSEIREVKASCGGKLLKVIVETCFLTQ